MELMELNLTRAGRRWLASMIRDEILHGNKSGRLFVCLFVCVCVCV